MSPAGLLNSPRWARFDLVSEVPGVVSCLDLEKRSMNWRRAFRRYSQSNRNRRKQVAMIWAGPADPKKNAFPRRL